MVSLTQKLVCSLVFCCGIPIPAHAAEEWANLFNGRNLEGWIQRGGKAVYSVENGEIVGTSTVNTPNTFLCTVRDYGDFVLEYEFKVDPKLNSGVQIRSQSFLEPTEIEWEGKKIAVPACEPGESATSALAWASVGQYAFDNWPPYGSK